MRIKRRFLYPGVFLIAMGAVLVASETNRIDEATITQALRFWPVAIIVLGVALVLRRTRVSLVGGSLAVAILGLSFGALFALGPGLAIGCSGNDQTGSSSSRQGTFAGPATIDLVMNCGEVSVDSSSGSNWSVATGNAQTVQPLISSTPTSLSVTTPDRTHGFGWQTDKDLWHVTVPTATAIDVLSAEISAGTATLSLPGAQLGRVSLTVNAGEARFDLSQASLGRLDASLNAGSLRIYLPNSDMTAALSVNVGEMRVCVPPDLGVRVHSDVTLGSADLPGLVNRGGYSETANYSTAARHADLTVSVNLGSVKLNPAGGCS